MLTAKPVTSDYIIRTDFFQNPYEAGSLNNILSLQRIDRAGLILNFQVQNTFQRHLFNSSRPL